ncbi:MAG: helix-turn-helix transcriptional regulator [Opitutaceae bacterium]|nr:helix-turn-helix transcriptional regulator [Opitutaceae bacterium]
MNGVGINLHLSVMISIAGKLCEVRLGMTTRVRCEPGWHWEPRLSDYDLWFVWAGRGSVRIDDEEVTLGPGAVLWMRPGLRYVATQDPEARLGVNAVHFELLDRGRALSAGKWTPPFEAMHTRQVDFVDLALQRVQALTRAAEGRVVAEMLFGAVLADLVRENVTGEAQEAGLERHHREIVERVAAQIRESPGNVPSVAELAKAAGYSVDHFAKIFARVTGESPQLYAINAKIKRARQLLAESSLSVGMIAEALGFRDVFFFSRQFRQRTGLTPTKYRKQLNGAGCV